MLDVQADGWLAIVVAKRLAWTAVFIYRNENINDMLRLLTTDNWVDTHIVENAIAGNEDAKVALSQKVAEALISLVKQMADVPEQHDIASINMMAVSGTIISHLVNSDFLALVEGEDNSLDLQSLEVVTIDEARQLTEKEIIQPMGIETYWLFES
jgi:hypothetical protein